MRDYAILSPTFWTGETGRSIIEVSSLEGAYQGASEGVVMALYLMSAPLSNMLGLYSLPVLYAAHDTGLGLQGASKGLQVCQEAGYCSYDEATKTVWVKEMAFWQIAKELNEKDNRCAGIQKAYDALPNSPFLGDFFDKYAKPFHMKRRRDGKGLGKGLPKPLGSQEQEQEQEQKKKKLSPTAHESPNLNGHDLLGEIPVKWIQDAVQPVVDASQRILPKCQRINVLGDERRKKILQTVKLAKRICREKGLDYEIFWEVYFEECDRDAWLRGDLPNPKNPAWKQNLLTLLAEKHFAKVMDEAFNRQESAP